MFSIFWNESSLLCYVTKDNQLFYRIYGWDARGLTKPLTDDDDIALSHIIVHDNGVGTISVIIHEIGHA